MTGVAAVAPRVSDRAGAEETGIAEIETENEDATATTEETRERPQAVEEGRAS